jgi:hypothetical protein
MQQQQKTPPKSKLTQKQKDILKTLRELENIAISNNSLQKKVDLMNLHMLRVIKKDA